MYKARTSALAEKNCRKIDARSGIRGENVPQVSPWPTHDPTNRPQATAIYLQLKKGILTYVASYLQRRVIILLDFDIRLCKTTDFVRVDGLSRLINRHQMEDEDSVIAAISLKHPKSYQFPPFPSVKNEYAYRSLNHYWTQEDCTLRN